jgi:TetR/AcrR family transcriptional repressor of nem operon
MARPTGRDIRQEVIDAAIQAIRSRGATAFSYASIADQLGIKAPSIHHHFPRKADLLTAAVAHYRSRFRHQVDELGSRTARERLEEYAALFLAPAQRDLTCMCGAAAADWNDIAAATRAEVTAFFDHEVAWVATQAAEAVDAGEFTCGLDTEAFATAFVAALEGALLLARTSADPTTVPRTAKFLLDQATYPAGSR